jgi:hypothetical protein
MMDLMWTLTLHYIFIFIIIIKKYVLATFKRFHYFQQLKSLKQKARLPWKKIQIKIFSLNLKGDELDLSMFSINRKKPTHN